jgi:hypothetical protein
MANIIGEPLENYVIQQIKDRQEIQGTGVAGTNVPFSPRDPKILSVLNSNTSWIKLASGVTIEPSELSKTLTKIPPGKELAKKYVLFSGISQFDGKKLNQREGFNPSSDISNLTGLSEDIGNNAYTYGEYGYSPMPGIISADIKTLNRGSIKKATIKIKAHNKQQFDIIDLLYLRLGYTVLLEWGNALYVEKSLDETQFERKDVGNTLIEKKFFTSNDNSYTNYLSDIADLRARYNGNYDGLLAKISNFSWTFNSDGSYDIDLTLISMGDVIESLKTNISIDKGTLNYVESEAIPLTDSNLIDDPIENNANNNIIFSMLWLWKHFGPSTNSIQITSSIDSSTVGYFLNKGPTSLDLSEIEVQYGSYELDISTNQWNPTLGSPENIKSLAPFDDANKRLIKNYKNKNPNTALTDEELESRIKNIKNTAYLDNSISPRQGTSVFYEWKTVTNTSTTNPLNNANSTDSFLLDTQEKQYYLRFGYLLEFISLFCIPQINNNPIINIDTNKWGSKMLHLQNQISLDPRICLARNNRFIKYNPDGTSKNTDNYVFKGLIQWIKDGKGYAYPLNIYLNFSFIIESLNSASDERGDVNLFSFISNICNGLNKALGGINNLEPVIDEETNTLYIIDSSLTNQGKKTNKYSLKLLGYKKQSNFYESNFIRGFDLKTAITPEYATMVTVGATAGGYVKGTEGTAFSKWNSGLTDRFKETISSSTSTTTSTTGSSVDEAEENYWKEIGNKKFECYGLTNPPDKIASDKIIEKNISIGTEYLKYKLSKSNSKQSSVGFIPFKLGIKMDGLSGIKIYQELNIDTSYLPINYGDSLSFIVTGVNHSLSNSDWVTELTTMVIPGKKQEDIILETGIIPTVSAPNIPNIDDGSGCPKQDAQKPTKVSKSYKGQIEKLFNKTYPESFGRKVYESFNGFKQVTDFYSNGKLTTKGIVAITQALLEGIGTSPERKNPGNIRKDSNSFKKFTTWKDGWSALNERYYETWAIKGNVTPTLSWKYSDCYSDEANTNFKASNLKYNESGPYAYKKGEKPTLRQFINIYAPWGDRNNPTNYTGIIAATLKDYGVNINIDDKMINWLNKN